MSLTLTLVTVNLEYGAHKTTLFGDITEILNWKKKKKKKL